MNEEPPPELAVVIKKNAEMTARTRLQKLSDTIVSDATGMQLVIEKPLTTLKLFEAVGRWTKTNISSTRFNRFTSAKRFGYEIIGSDNSSIDSASFIGQKCSSNNWSRWRFDMLKNWLWNEGIFHDVGWRFYDRIHPENWVNGQRCYDAARLQHWFT